MRGWSCIFPLVQLRRGPGHTGQLRLRALVLLETTIMVESTGHNPRGLGARLAIPLIIWSQGCTFFPCSSTPSVHVEQHSLIYLIPNYRHRETATNKQRKFKKKLNQLLTNVTDFGDLFLNWLVLNKQICTDIFTVVKRQLKKQNNWNIIILQIFYLNILGCHIDTDKRRRSLVGRIRQYVRSQ